MEVADAVITVAVVPLNLTILFEGTGSKSLPDIVTDVPTLPLVGEKLASGVNTVKSDADKDVFPLIVTEIFPDDAPAGTITVKEVEEAVTTVAAVALNLTVLFDGVGSKL
jgi:hypothetical protein